VRENLIRAGCCLSAQRGGKEFAKELFDIKISAHKTGWKLILSENVGNLLHVVVEIIHMFLILNVLSTTVRIKPNL